MTRARILADYVAGGTTATEFDHMDGVTSNVQTQLDAKAPKASPAFTGTPTGIVRGSLAADIIDGTKLADDAVDSEHVAADSLDAEHYAAGSVDATAIANDAVDSQHYAADSIDTEHYAPASVDTTAMAASVIGVKPHIIPDVLYPAVAGKLLDGSTSHGATYGVAQADGFSYYYTDIKGSKPIKDPRIGAHFGSQRHKFKSIQKLEQETATHGKDVYSVDGREWMRAIGDVNMNNTDGGVYLVLGASGEEIEITGYFNDANIILETGNNQENFALSLNGTALTLNQLNITSATPLSSRYVDNGSVANISFSSTPTLGINTIKIGYSHWLGLFGIELIAQDTTSTATKSQIQIPSQNVVSYGKKFTVADTPHYNPFATKGDDSASTIPNNTTGDSVDTGWAGSTDEHWDSSLDTATSLGLGAWESGGNYYRPVNGGRVVKWVDSTGAIKTSVNMMPPEADRIGTNTGTCDATGTHNWSTQYLPQFGNKRIGSNLITTWTNSSSYAFGTFTLDSGNNADFDALVTGSGAGLSYAWSNTISFTKGSLYKLRMNITHGSGSAIPNLILGDAQGADGQISNLATTDDSTWTFTADWDGSYDRVISIQINNDSANWSNIDFTLYEIEDPSSQAEVAKTFNYREFGNGAANGGTGGSYADASMLNAVDDIAYVMDDGLTSLSGDDVVSNAPPIAYANTTNKGWYFTFIGTGFTFIGRANGSNVPSVPVSIVQNLPYGTHIVKIYTKSDDHEETVIHIDGVQVYSAKDLLEYAGIVELTIHQPKMPPIPEDAIVIADYMLMADFVVQSAVGVEKISKGVRRQDSSRDVFYDGATVSNADLIPDANTGKYRNANRIYITTDADGSPNSKVSIPSFGRGGIVCYASASDKATNINLKIDGTLANGTTNYSHYHDGTPETDGTFTQYHASFLTGKFLGAVHKTDISSGGVELTEATASKQLTFEAIDLVTPIHTSSHYQTFETPYLHELVGGDRNMEQTNLVVTPDGKTWDEVTRDVSYIGNMVLNINADSGNVAENTVVIFDEILGFGTDAAKLSHFYKDFAIAYDRQICLVDGQYVISYTTQSAADATDRASIFVNGVVLFDAYTNDASYWNTIGGSVSVHLKRGDYVQIKGGYFSNSLNKYSSYHIERI